MPEGMPSWFMERDRDADGQVGMYEWPKDDLAEFRRNDRNGDGFITIEECRWANKPKVTVATTAPTPDASSSSTPAPGTPPAPGTSPPPGSAPTVAGGPALSGGGDEERLRRGVQENLLDRYDRNRDGKLDEQEIQQTRMLKFSWKQYDNNKNNVMEMDEMLAYMRSMSGGRGFGGGGPSGFGGGSGGFSGGRSSFGGGGNESPEERSRSFIARFDTNKDGKLSVEELPFFIPKDRFPELDSNRDGVLDLQEFQQGMEKLRGGRR